MELKETIKMMTSEDYKERFKAEYMQTKIRYDKLHKMCIKHEAGTLNFTPKCSIDLLKEQKKYMGMYLHSLEVRAEIEGISLDCLPIECAFKLYHDSSSTAYADYLTSTIVGCGDAPNATLATNSEVKNHI